MPCGLDYPSHQIPGCQPKTLLKFTPSKGTQPQWQLCPENSLRKTAPTDQGNPAEDRAEVCRARMLKSFHSMSFFFLETLTACRQVRMGTTEEEKFYNGHSSGAEITRKWIQNFLSLHRHGKCKVHNIMYRLTLKLLILSTIEAISKTDIKAHANQRECFLFFPIINNCIYAYCRVFSCLWNRKVSTNCHFLQNSWHCAPRLVYTMANSTDRAFSMVSDAFCP